MKQLQKIIDKANEGMKIHESISQKSTSHKQNKHMALHATCMAFRDFAQSLLDEELATKPSNPL